MADRGEFRASRRPRAGTLACLGAVGLATLGMNVRVAPPREATPVEGSSLLEAPVADPASIHVPPPETSDGTCPLGE